MMRCRLVAALACLGALAACGEAVPSPGPADAEEQQVLKEAAEMLPVAEPAPETAGEPAAGPARAANGEEIPETNP